MARNPLTKLGELTDRQHQLLRYVVSFYFHNRVMPSVREMSRALGLSSANASMPHVRALVKKGYLICPEDRYLPRAYVIAGITTDFDGKEMGNRLKTAIGEGWESVAERG